MSKFYTIFSRPPRVVSPHGGKSLTDESCLADTDMNTILRRYNCGDQSVVRSAGVFADVSELGDFAHSLNVINKAKEDFAALPAEVRDRFGNDPRALVDFLADASNDDEALRLGLKVKHEQEKSLADQIVEGVTRAAKSSTAAASV